MPTTVVIGSSLTDPTPTAKDEFAYGPDGQRYYKKTSWDDSGTQRVEYTFYVGGFEELITDSSNPSYKAIKKTRVDSSAMTQGRMHLQDLVGSSRSIRDSASHPKVARARASR